ncbi:transcriptional regulator MraZ [Betaproteobacteria bacterium]|nr:transcriptional regulator MraZ [Betaproteobacteria bacterium]GHT92541.1 transcriptional regulator MraZ [Betaproteobacteria bacterium]GHU00715.1 transcriptional regulator MraZ [Betaproteobacteria bacterium]GHU17634.1 transcriptional regulator MraZ [Betaproteobacteria bacterium]GHU25684.1 transcriptional regulator MraZ [Betaproteobacteria bacterium]
MAKHGRTAISLDAKSRLAIPARYRDVLAPNGEPVTLVAHEKQRCLSIYSQEDWKPILEKLAALDDTIPANYRLKYKRLAFSHTETLDTAGRVLIPKSLRDYAGLDKQVVLAGMGDRYDLWSEEGDRKLHEGFQVGEEDVLSLMQEGGEP